MKALQSVLTKHILSTGQRIPVLNGSRFVFQGQHYRVQFLAVRK